LGEKLGILRETTRVFPAIDYRYVRSSLLSQRIAERQRDLEQAREIIADGVEIKRIVLVAWNADLPPFDVKCRTFRSDTVADFEVLEPE
ncbi:hypothetical protein ABTM02_20210, partial [Acinetobacter baumannii]